MGAAMNGRPRLLPAVLAVLAPLVVLVGGRLVRPPQPGPGLLPRLLLAELALLVVTVALVAWTGWWRQTGLVGPWRQRWWILIPAGLLLIQLLLGLPGLMRLADPARLPIVIPLVAMVGFCEETLTRGVMLYGLSRFGPLVAGLVTSAIFGLLHVIGLLSAIPVSFLVFQVIGAMLLGLLFAGLRYRMISIWPVIVIHALYDVPALLTGYPLRVADVSLAAGLFSTGLLLPFGLAGLGLLLWDQLNGTSLWPLPGRTGTHA
jgi:membrane protease YdiL (CAAX protease family)